MDFMVYKKEQYHKGRKIEASLNIVDLYSNLLISYLTPNQDHKTVIKCLKDAFATHPTPAKIVSDNATALCKHQEVLKFLKKEGVSVVTTTTPYNSKGNKTERMNKILREALQLVKETFRRESVFDMYHTAIKMINSRPLSLALHPHIRETLGKDVEVVTPFSLHFGIKQPQHPLIPLEDTLEPASRTTYRAKWMNILAEHEQRLKEEHKDRLESFKEGSIEIGDLVLIRNMIAHKEQLKFYKDIYEVVKIEKARYHCQPLFSGGKPVEVNGNNIKPYQHSELYQLLPKEITDLMGENLSVEQIKQHSKDNRLPLDLSDWKFWRKPSQMQLRRRLTPESKVSEPAINPRDSIISESSMSSDSTSMFQVPDKIPDFLSIAADC